MTPKQKALLAELDELNAAVQEAVTKRRAWMDSHMEDFAKFKVGDEIYDLETCKRLGKVTELYRYWANRSDYDTSMRIDYKYETKRVGNSTFTDNTSRQPCMVFGTAEEARARLRSRADALQLHRG